MSPGEILSTSLKRAPLDFKVVLSGDHVLVTAKAMPAVKLSAISAGEGWPSDARDLLTHVGSTWPSDLVAVAPRLSPGAVRVLLSAGANWADLGGEIRIVRPGLHVYGFANGSPARETLPAGSTLRWNRSLTDITEWLLNRPNASVGVTEIAGATGWSQSLVSREIRTLQGHGWLKAHGRGPGLKRTLDNPGSLLDAWSAGVALRPTRRRLAYVLMPSPDTFIRRELAGALDGALNALTGWAAASIVAPYAGSIPSVHVYVESLGLALLWQRWLDSPSPRVRPVDDGANVIFLEADSHLFRHVAARDGMQVASPPRVYADLMALGGRAVDAAAHLREVAIGF